LSNEPFAAEPVQVFIPDPASEQLKLTVTDWLSR